MSSTDEDEYEYDYSDNEDYIVEDDDDGMDWNSASIATENPNAAPTISGTLLVTNNFVYICRRSALN